MGTLVRSAIDSASDGVYIDDNKATRVTDTFPVDFTVTVSIANPYYIPPATPDDPPPSQPPYLTVTVDIHGKGEICSGTEGITVDSQPAARKGDAVKCDFYVGGSITPPADSSTGEQYGDVGYSLHVTGTGIIEDVSGVGILEGKKVARIGDPVTIDVEVSVG